MSEQNAVLQPSLLGLNASFGFGDRLGLAGPGHLEACRNTTLLPILAQQSIRELTRTGRTPEAVMAAARSAVISEKWAAPWGADGDHLKTPEDVRLMAGAGFTFFTIDPSDYVNNDADRMQGDALSAGVDAVIRTGAFESVAEIEALYLGKTEELPGVDAVSFDSRESLFRAVVKYGRAVAHARVMRDAIVAAAGPAGAEIELSVDETDTPTSPLEHLFIAMELQRRGVKVISLAPRFVGDFEKGVDYKGDLVQFEQELKVHAAISQRFGPYKISVHSGSDKFSIYPIIARVCGKLLHVKTAGTSYLEALRVLARTEPALFLEIVNYSISRFEADKVSYHISADLARSAAPHALSPAEREKEYLDLNNGRQILHVTFGSVLTAGKTAAGQSFREALLTVLDRESGLHRELLAAHLGRHVQLLQQG